MENQIKYTSYTVDEKIYEYQMRHKKLCQLSGYSHLLQLVPVEQLDEGVQAPSQAWSLLSFGGEKYSITVRACRVISGLNSPTVFGCSTSKLGRLYIEISITTSNFLSGNKDTAVRTESLPIYRYASLKMTPLGSVNVGKYAVDMVKSKKTQPEVKGDWT